MSNEKKKYFLYIGGQAVSVTKQVYDAYWHYTEKEEYFMEKLKMESFVCDQGTQSAAFFPSREDSYERFMELKMEFPAPDSSVEDQVMASILLEEVLRSLPVEEQEIIHQFYYLNKTEREACAAMNMPKTTFHRKSLFNISSRTSLRRIFRRSTLLNLEIHKGFLRFRALIGEKSARKSAHAEILNRL